MFVRIVWKGDGDQTPLHVMDELIQSDYVQIGQPTLNNEVVFVTVSLNGRHKCFRLPKDGTEIRFMNDSGEPIFDSYRWSADQAG